MNETRSTYYIVSARCYQVKAFNGNVLTRDDEEAWLGYDDGYPQWRRSKTDAHHFFDPKKARREALSSDGMPWYFHLKPGSIRIVEVNKKVVTDIIETETELH